MRYRTPVSIVIGRPRALTQINSQLACGSSSRIGEETPKKSEPSHRSGPTFSLKVAPKTACAIQKIGFVVAQPIRCDTT